MNVLILSDTHGNAGMITHMPWSRFPIPIVNSRFMTFKQPRSFTTCGVENDGFEPNVMAISD